jgi:hypothetical protein
MVAPMIHPKIRAALMKSKVAWGTHIQKRITQDINS